MKERYGTAGDFLGVFTPALQTYAARYPVRAYTGTAPTLQAVLHGYGERTLEVFLCLELEDLNMFAGVKTKLSLERQRELAGIVRSEYPFLKVSEILLFFHRLKCGRYGRFYGSVDALFITSALAQFIRERQTELNQLEDNRKQQQQNAPPVSEGITYDEYLQRKQLKQNNHEE